MLRIVYVVLQCSVWRRRGRCIGNVSVGRCMMSESKLLKISQHDKYVAELQGTARGMVFRYKEVMYASRQNRIRNARMAGYGACSFCGYIHSERKDLSLRYHQMRGVPYEDDNE